MAIIKNKSTEVGDVIYIKADVPIVGLVALQSFIDLTVGETGTKLFIKRFRYSVDGVNYSAWIDLTDANLQLVQVQSNDTFFAEYSYQRSGSDTSGTLEFDSVTINGDYSVPVVGPAYLNSNFSTYFDLNNLCSIAWSVNVLEKLYKRGILPKYIERNFNSDNATDRDFLDNWRAITHYFALFVCLARHFQFFYQDPTLLLEYLNQRGLLLCSDTDYNDLLYLMSNYYDEVRQRGTRKVFLPKGNVSPAGVKAVDGEYLRLICFDPLDEFLYNLNKNEHIGWSLGNSSPLYKGTEGRLNLNKYYCDFIDDTSVNELSINSTSLPYVKIVVDHTLDDDSDESQSESVSNSDSGSNSDPNENDRVIQILSAGAGNPHGLGKGDKRIIVNPHLDYEITFFIKMNGNTVSTFDFGVDCWDKNDNVINTTNISTLSSSSTFLSGVSLNKADRYYFVRGVLYNKNTYKGYSGIKLYETDNIVTYLGSYYRAKRAVPIAKDPVSYPLYWQALTAAEVASSLKTNLGTGNNLRFTDNIVKIDPFILYEGSAGTPAVSSFTIFRIDSITAPRTLTLSVDGYGLIAPPFLTASLDRIQVMKDTVVLINGYQSDYLAVYNVGLARIDLYGLSGVNSGFTVTNDPLGMITYTYGPFVGGTIGVVGSKSVYIYNIRVQPLSTKYSKGFMNTTNLLELWSTNNNLTLSETQVNNATKHYFIPMSCALKNNFVTSEINS